MSTDELIEKMRQYVHAMRGAGFDRIRELQALLRPVEVELTLRLYANVTGGRQ